MFTRTAGIPIRKKEEKNYNHIFKQRGGFNLRIDFIVLEEMKEQKRELR